MPQSCIKVGIDFGTTYSAVAWVHTSCPGEINVIQSWPHGRVMRECDKVPTKIVYDSSFVPYGYKWGFEAESHTNKIFWPKLLLDPTQKRRTPSLSPVLRQIKTLLPANKRPVDVVADYLLGLGRHLKVTLSRRYGAELLENVRVEYVLTVPAVWSDGAKALTLKAAETAGFGSSGSIQLIAEPEAAAVYSLQKIQPNHLKVGDTFVVADCGGGTVDLVSYQITQLSPIIEVKEHAVGGDLCGSAFINQAFEDFVSKRMGKTKLEKMRPKARSMMLRAFDDLKKIVSEEDGETSYSIPAPGLEDDEEAGIDEGLLLLTKKDIKTIFDPVTDQVIELVQQQVATVENNGSGKASAIVLVGGFGNSEYLRQQLKMRIKSTVDNTAIPILRPAHPWTAVVRGAVLRTLGSLVVTSRLARYHYGVAVSATFVRGLHPEREKFWSEHHEEWRCKNRANWFITKGTEVRDDEVIRHEFCRIFPSDYVKGVINQCLYACAKDKAPDASNDTSVFLLCKLSCDMRSVPAYHFKPLINLWARYQMLEFELIMRIKSAQLMFSMEIDGIEYSNVTAKFV